MVCDALTTARRSSCSGCRATVVDGPAGLRLDQAVDSAARIAHLAVRAPPGDSGRGPRAGKCDDRLDPLPVEARRRLVRDRLVVDETSVARRNRIASSYRCAAASRSPPGKARSSGWTAPARFSKFWGSFAPRPAVAGGARRAPANVRAVFQPARRRGPRRARAPRKSGTRRPLGTPAPSRGRPPPSRRPRGPRHGRARRSAPAACRSSTNRRRAPGPDAPGVARTRSRRSRRRRTTRSEGRALGRTPISRSCVVRTSTTRPNFVLRAEGERVLGGVLHFAERGRRPPAAR